MKISIYKNHNAGTVFRTGNAGTEDDSDDVGGLDLSDIGGGKTPANPDPNAGKNNGTSNEENDQEAAKKTAEDLALAQSFGGVKLDEQGNVLGADGKIVKTAEEIQKAAEPKAIEIDGVEYALNEKGEAVDKDGKVIKTTEEVNALVLADSEIPLVEELITKVGIKIKGEDGKPKIYPDTVEGIIEYNNDLAEYKSRVAQQKFFEKFPSVAKYAEHLARGGNDKDYFTKQSSSWLNVTLDEKNETQLHEVIVANLVAGGMSKEEADYTAKVYKDTGKLVEFGKKAFDRLQGAEKAADKLQREADERDNQNEQIRIKKYWDDRADVIKKGVINKILIPEADRVPFIKYISEAVNENGNSQEELDDTKLSVEDELAIRFLKYKKLDLKTIVQNAVGTQNVQVLRKRLKDVNTISGDKGAGAKSAKSNNDADIDLDKF